MQIVTHCGLSVAEKKSWINRFELVFFIQHSLYLFTWPLSQSLKFLDSSGIANIYGVNDRLKQSHSMKFPLLQRSHSALYMHSMW